jgi:hypothetical protein
MKRAEDLERELLQKLEEARAHKPDLYPDAVGLPGPGAELESNKDQRMHRASEILIVLRQGFTRDLLQILI